MTRTPATLLGRLAHCAAQADDWTRFVQLFTPLLDRWAHGFGLQDADAADLVQEVFLKLLKRLPTFQYDNGRTFRGWLWTITVNEYRDRAARRAEQTLSPEALAQLADPDRHPNATEAEFRSVILARALQMLQGDFAPETWQAFTQTAIDGKPVAEVAASLGLSANSVYLARSRVLARLRQEVGDLVK